MPQCSISLLIVLVGLGGLCSSGCSKTTSRANTPDVGRPELEEIWEIYQMHASQKGRPPAHADDLKPFARGAPLGGRPLSDPNFVVRYGTPTGGSLVLAYHKDVPAQGGLVLMSNGKISPMSAAEFAAAPKTGK